nr:MAG TPA: Putative HNHc nuclease [Bacteriophage sp.]
MHTLTEIQKVRQTEQGTDLIIHIPDLQLLEMLTEKRIRQAEIRFDDGRHISIEQRKKAYATIRDIAAYTGYLPEEQKEWLKYLHIARTGCEYFSLSDCTMDTAREFINTILEYAITEGVPLTDAGAERTDDIGKYLYFCLKAKKCCVCGAPGEIHHVDAIGMGNDRRTYDDTQCRKMCLCRKHHTTWHQMGDERFQKMYKVYGILMPEEKSSLAEQ